MAMDGKIDIKQVVGKIFSRWYYFLISVGMVVPLAFLYTEIAAPVYHVRASILLNNEMKSGIHSEKFLKGMELLKSQTEIEDEIGILKSLDLVESTIHRLNFGISYFRRYKFRTKEIYADESPFIIELDSGVSQLTEVPIYIERTSGDTYSVRVSANSAGTYNFTSYSPGEMVREVDIHSLCFIDKPFEHEWLSFNIKFNKPFEPDPDGTVYYFVIHNLDALAKSYQATLDIKPISRESNIVEINLKGKVAKKEMLFLNTLLNVYLINELNKRQQLGQKTIEFIDQQLKGVSEELQNAESSLETFRSQNNILNLNVTADHLVKNIDKLDDEKSKLEVKLKYYRYIATVLGKDEDPNRLISPSTLGVEDQVLNTLLLELMRLYQERTSLNYSAQEENPLAEVNHLKIASTKKALMDNVNNFIDASTAALTDLNNKIDALQRKVNVLPRSERELVSIQRQFDFNDNVFNYLLEKRAEAGIATASNSMEKTIVDKAHLVGNGPVSPNRMLILLIAFIASLSLAGGLVIIKDLMSDNIVTSEDIEKVTPIPFIGAIAHGTRHARASAIVAHTNSELGESFRSLRVNLQYLTSGRDDDVIGVTSSVLSEGKTFCSINLAAAMALAGKDTLLIDADLRRPSVAAVLGIDNKSGLSDYLNGTCSLPDIVKPTWLEGLDVITSGPIPPNPLELIGLPEMGRLINQMKEQYDTVVIDSPPIGYVAEYIILMKYTNTNIYVVRSNFTGRQELQKINRLYKENKIRNVKIVLNDAKSGKNGYYYAYK
jgi:capsular exopolysaccharide synthesis family protein